MEHADVVRRRRMVRSYDPTRPVAPEVVEELLSAALRAPSAGHTQGVSFLVLSEADDLDSFWASTSEGGEPDRWLHGMRTAPVLVLVWTSAEAYQQRYAAPDKGWTDPELHADQGRWSAPYWFVDAGMAAMALLLSAVDHGLGACFFGVPPERLAAVRQTFAVPAEQLSVGVVSLGHPAPGAAVAGPSRRARRPRAERVHRGRWTEVGHLPA